MSERVAILKLASSASFLKCRWTGIRPARASVPPVGEVRKAPVIHRAALCCILVLGAFEEPESETVRCNQENASTVVEALLQRRKAPRRIAEHPHCLDGGERLGGVVPNVLGEEQLPVKVEP